MDQAWRDVVYAQEGDFRKAWNDMLVCFGTQQRAIIDYIISKYLSWGEQFLQYQIKRYRNFGQRTNSPTETAHKDVKSSNCRDRQSPASRYSDPSDACKKAT